MRSLKMSILDKPTVDEWTKSSREHMSKKASALDTQVGGSHYKDYPIQPIEFVVANKLGFCEGNVVKYITRYAHKGGRQDLDKVIHYVQLLKELTNDEG
jgi:hypothetical protein